MGTLSKALAPILALNDRVSAVEHDVEVLKSEIADVETLLNPAAPEAVSVSDAAPAVVDATPTSGQ